MASWSIRYGERMEIVNTSTDGERGCSKEGRSGKKEGGGGGVAGDNSQKGEWISV